MNNQERDICETEIEYAILDPFNIAFYDISKDRIFIDVKVRKTDIEQRLIEHEQRHIKKNIFHEPVNKQDFKIFPEVLKYKPLMLLQFLFPFVLGRDLKGGWIFKVELLGLIVLIPFIVMVSMLFTYNTIYCEKVGILLTNCQRCYLYKCMPTTVTTTIPYPTKPNATSVTNLFN